MQRNFFLIFIALFGQIHSAIASEAIAASLPQASLVGQGVLSYAFWDIYEARLYAPQGRWERTKPFALSLTYYQEISGKDIADRSTKEIRQQGFHDEVQIAAWNSQMKAIFPNVTKGTTLSAIYIPKEHTTFYHGNDVIGVIRGEQFAELFFGIWLSEKTSEPKLRNALLGNS